MQMESLPVRLGWGKLVMGPEFTGCINSGHRALICKSKDAERWTGKPFVVCFDFAWRFMKHETICEAMSGKKNGLLKSYRVRFYKTYASARADFERRCNETRKEYDNIGKQAEIFKTGNYQQKMKAAFALSDYGVI